MNGDRVFDGPPPRTPTVPRTAVNGELKATVERYQRWGGCSWWWTVSSGFIQYGRGFGWTEAQAVRRARRCMDRVKRRGQWAAERKVFR